MLQWLRKVRVTFSGSSGTYVINPGGNQTDQLKVAFSISKGISGSANSAEIQIWNMNEDHRNSVGKELDDVVLEAGYMPPGGSSNVGIIFSGQMRDVEHEKNGPDIITRLSCGEGDRALRKAVISKTYPKGTPVQEVVEAIYLEFEKQGIKKGEWKFPDNMKIPKRPYSACAPCSRELNSLGRSNGFYWSIQNGTMEVIPGDGFLPGVVLLNSSTGLIGVPTITDNGVKVSALLNPEIRPNRTVKIESEVLEMNGENGLYRVSQIEYTGDNRDGNFEVQIHGEAIKSGKVDEGISP
jgi:hypothetical protein